MHYDAVTLACITTELKNTLVPGRVQQVLQTDDHSFGLEIYAHNQRHYLLLCAEPSASRAHLVTEKLRRGPEQPTPLLQLMRKYVRDALLQEVIQPDSTERLLQLHFNHAEHGPTVLVLEPMGKLSNLLLLKPNPATPQGLILDCLRRVPAGERAQRLVMPGKPYTPPPSQAKLSPIDSGQPEYYEYLANILTSPQPLWKALLDGMAGISPTLGREIAWRASGNTETVAKKVELVALVAALQELWQPVTNGEWHPGLWYEAEQVVGFSAYPAHGRGEFQPMGSLSAALELYFVAQERQRKERSTATANAGADAYAAQRRQVAKEIEQVHRRLQRQLSSLSADEPAPGAAEKVRTQAEWLLALASQIKPDQTTLEVDLGDGETLSVALEANRTPIEQAQRMFKEAGRLERAAEFIPQRRARLQADVEFINQMATDLLLATNQPEIAAVHSELVKTGLVVVRDPKAVARNAKAPLPTAKVGRPHSFISPTGLEIVVGRNARQNEFVTFEVGQPGDRWLHVRGAPGSHVVIRNHGQPVDEETLQMAAQLAAYHSHFRGELSAPVIVTERRHVRRAPGGHPGQVLVQKEEVLFVAAVMP